MKKSLEYPVVVGIRGRGPRRWRLRGASDARFGLRPFAATTLFRLHVRYAPNIGARRAKWNLFRFPSRSPICTRSAKVRLHSVSSADRPARVS